MALKAKNMATEKEGKINTDEKESSEKAKALELAISQIEKRFGKGSVMKLGENTSAPIPVIPSGSLALDLALGVGGIPKGRITEIFGPEASGKTTLAQHIIAQAQKRGEVAAYIDVEHALDRSYASDCGVKTEDLYISQPDTGEQALEITEALVRSGAIDVIVVDSVAALVPQAEIEGEMGESHVGLQARLMSQALRKLTAAISKSNAAVIFINQLREKVGIVYGNPEVTPGGRALKFYSSVRIDLRRTETIMQGNEAVGNRVKAKIVKNKVAPPFKSAEFDIMFSRGISKEGDLVDLGVQQGIISKSGAFFSYGDVRVGQGRENAKTFLTEHPELAEEIEQKIRASAAAVPSSPTAGESAD
jgi:recombination protein RecA